MERKCAEIWGGGGVCGDTVTTAIMEDEARGVERKERRLNFACSTSSGVGVLARHIRSKARDASTVNVEG